MSEKNLIPLSNELAQSKKNNRISGLLTHTAIFSAAFLPQNLQAQEKTTLLPTVSVIDSRADEKYVSSNSSLFQLRSPLLETPKTIATVSRELMDDQNSTTIRDALRNVPGISLAAGEGGGGAQGDNLTIRGFSARSDFFIDGMRDFGAYYRDPFNTESVEVVQGPASILFGRGSSGGVIEQNSKEAFLGSYNKSSFTLGTNETARATTDVNAKINGLEGAAFRLNAMVNDNKFAGRDVVQNKRFGIAPSLVFGLGSDNRLNLNYFHQTEDNIPDYGIPWYQGRPADVKRSNFYGFQDDYFKTNVDIATAKFEHDFDDETTFKNQFRYARYARNGRATQPSTTNGTTVSRTMIAIDSVETYIGDQADLATKFETIGIEHDALAGVSISHETSDPTRYTYNGVASTSLTSPSEDETFSGATSIATRSKVKAEVDTLSVYALDTLHLNKKWDLVLGLRFDNIDSGQTQQSPTSVNLSRTDNVVSRNASLVYKPTLNSSVYINYGTSFNPSAETLALTDASSRSQSMTPEKNETYEVGTKWDFFKKKLSTAFAIFHTKKSNARELNSSNVYVISGTQNVDGFQAQINGKLTNSWSINAGYAFLDAKLDKSSYSAREGNTLANVPQHNLSLFTTYKLPSALEFGVGMNLLSSRFGDTQADSTTGQQKKAPGYVTFNAMAKYPVSKAVEIQLNVNNLFNTNYADQIYSGHVVPGEGRVLLLSTNIKF